MFFRPLSAGTASVIASNIQVYLNDGLGTETHATVDPITVAIQRNSSPDQGFGYDTEPPLDFAPILFHEPLVYDGKFAIIFSAKDAGSGIDYYEVKEGNNSWIHATSPYLINDQSLSNSILVKVVDKAGNERIENVPLPVSTTNSQTIYNFIAVIIVFAILCVIIIWRRCPTQKQYSN